MQIVALQFQNTATNTTVEYLNVFIFNLLIKSASGHIEWSKRSQNIPLSTSMPVW